MENHFNVHAQNVVAVAYRRWLFTRGSNCKSLTGKVLVFWIGGHLWEVVAHGGSTVVNIFNNTLYQCTTCMY